ncbi:MAG: family N-acetyltransferase [Verrucomicrobia bacterium]|nr:family N-acetyltransferase [Verrucomicrobiota bacterium]
MMRRDAEPGLIHPVYRAVRLGRADAAAGGHLSTTAGWNQTERDWNFLLRSGQGFGFETEAAQLIASAVVTFYGKEIAWLSMVLVAPEFRSQGIAAALLRHASSLADAHGGALLLDATPAGRNVYAAAGFRDLFSITRWFAPVTARKSGSDPLAKPIPIQALSRWTTWDEVRFGPPRKSMLTALASARPDLALEYVDREGNAHGYGLGRSGRVATQVGPIVADSTEAARALLRSALDRTQGAVICDVVDGSGTMEAELRDRGFAPERPFTRMARGPVKPWGIATGKSLFVTAGPELG